MVCSSRHRQAATNPTTSPAAAMLLGFYVNALSNDEIVTPEELREKYLSVNREQIIERARLMKEETVFFLCALEEEM